MSLTLVFPRSISRISSASSSSLSLITQEFVLARDLVFLYGFGLNTAAWPWRVTVIIHLNLDDSPAKPPGFSSGKTEKEIKALFKASN